MIEKVVYDYLSDQLDVPVYMEEPSNKPDSYVIIEKTGTSSENYIYRATMAVQSYASSLFLAAELNGKVIQSMNEMSKVKGICAVDLNSDYNFTDATTKRYRYQAIFDLVHYKEVLDENYTRVE